MLIARVVGSAISTIKDDQLTGVKLLIVQEADTAGNPTGKPLVAIDSVGAGVDDVVLIASGSSARQTPITENRPVDAVIMAILETLEVEGTITYRQSPT
ncbi:MAG: EutN/CcmL family microcompartment protein [Chloroflexota bacterium]